MTHYSKSSHVGTCLSIVEILYVLYFKIMKVDPENPLKPDRDKFILSKGHGSAALYSTLAERGFFSKEILNRYYIDDGILPGHLDMKAVPGIELSTGSLGHGLSVGVGMSIANMLDNNPGNIYVLLGDGECNEGSVWEAAMLASHNKLNNITAIIDCNKLQGFGNTKDIINQENLAERWKSFGWDVLEVDGHSIFDLESCFNQPATMNPKVIIAHTVKGKGVSFMEDKLEWHYKSPNTQELEKALKELSRAL
ncbi:transketolase [Paenibacillus validus]|uniref:Transketolase n=2 Tax=Paenibacillus TaxID=44249 RepID=A0A7X2ZCT9_9BACL|nr:transketolase [Paenibacillus validus]